MQKNNLKNLTLCAVYSALATISFVLETLLPPLVLPGARIGVSNLFILLATFTLGYWQGYFVLIVKCLLGSLFSANISALIYSLSAGITSLSAQILIFVLVNKASIISISVFGAVINITTQNTVFCLITRNFEYFVYLPYLALIGVVGGLTVGFAVYLLIRKLPQKVFDR